MSAPKSCLFAPLKSGKFIEGRVEKKLKEVNGLNNSVNNIKEKITYFNDENRKSLKKIKTYNVLSSVLKTVGKIVFSATSSTSDILSVTGFGLIVIPVSTTTASGLPVADKAFMKFL